MSPMRPPAPEPATPTWDRQGIPMSPPPRHWRPVHWFDRVFYAALPRLSFFSDGWGDDAILDSVTMAELPTLPPAEIDVALKPERGWLGTRFLGT